MPDDRSIGGSWVPVEGGASTSSTFEPEKSFEDRKGGESETSYQYDEFDRVVKIDYGNGQTKTFEYDSYGKVLRSQTTEIPRGIYSHINKTVSTVDFSYDQFGRIASKTVRKQVIPFNQYPKEAKDETLNYQYTYTPSGKRQTTALCSLPENDIRSSRTPEMR